MKIWKVEYNVCENYEDSNIGEFTVYFKTEKEAEDFYEDLPKYIEKHYNGSVLLVNRYPPLGSERVYEYDRENLQLEEA